MLAGLKEANSMDPLSTARYGMMTAQSRLARSADRVANWNGGDVDLVQETVEQIEARTQFAANAKVVGFASDMWRALMDIHKA
jgi:flagellar basal body rod protein FlgG